MPNVSKVTDQAIVEAITRFTILNGYPPTFDEIGKIVGFASKNTVSKRINRLRDAGILTYKDGKPRTVRVIRGYTSTRTDVRGV